MGTMEKSDNATKVDKTVDKIINVDNDTNREPICIKFSKAVNEEKESDDKVLEQDVDKISDDDDEDIDPEIICVQFSKPAEHVNNDDGSKVVTVKFPRKK